MQNIITQLAHVKWFNNQAPIPQPNISLLEAGVAGVLLIGALLTFWILNRYQDKLGITKKIDDALKPLREWVPTIVRLSTGVLLLINAAQDFLLAPNVTYDGSGEASLARGLFMAAAALLILGFLTEVGSALLLAGYFVLFAIVEPVDVLDHFEYIAIAGYLLLRGPGRLSIDQDILKRRPLLSDYRQYSLPVYRIGVGIGLATLALSEKLLNFTVAQDFLNQHDWNMLSLVGVSDRWFIVVAGAVELAVGLALILNISARLVMLVTLILMTITAILLGIDEIYGHIFAVGIVVAVWVNDRKPKKA